MRAFDYIKEPEKLLTSEIVQMIGKIHEHKGKQDLFRFLPFRLWKLWMNCADSF